MNNSHKIFAIVAVSILLLAFVYPQGVNRAIDFFNKKMSLDLPKVAVLRPFQLGLDLLGGTHLVYEADLSKIDSAEKDSAMEGIRDVVERRVNFFGVSEPVIQISEGNRLVVDLAGIKDVSQAIELIGETPLLEFKDEISQTDDIIQAQSQGKRLDESPFKSTGLNGSHLKRAQLTFDSRTYSPEVSLELTDAGAKLFGEITKRNIGKRVAIYLDGFPISIPIVQSEIADGKAVISGRFTPTEAKMLATRLNSGALPVPIKLVSQQTVGASLGIESLTKSLKAGLYGFISVALFMILYYRLPGALAVAALAVYVLVVLAVYKLIPVTLGLAGIAGFILSMGMAVDANVLIFSRMREELKAGKSLSQAVSEGFSRAWLSIRDSHITTLIGALILYMFTSSIVKGFALTLGIGVVMSLVSALFVTRSFLMIFIRPRFESKKWLF